MPGAGCGVCSLQSLFHTEGGEPGISPPLTSSFPLKLCRLLPYICIAFPPQELYVPYLAISKIMILSQWHCTLAYYSKALNYVDPYPGCFLASQGLTCTITCTSYMKVQKVYLPQQSQSLGESHPVPAQTLPVYKNCKSRATEVPSLEN